MSNELVNPQVILEPYVDFSFGDMTSQDLGIIRVTNGNMFELDLTPQHKDFTINGNFDGAIYAGSIDQKRQFNIPFAFEHLTENKLQELKRFLNDNKQIKQLSFAEEPNKYWSAYISDSVILNHIPFDQITINNNTVNGVRWYNGEGIITFTCLYPYAYSEKKTVILNSSHTGTFNNDGTLDTYLMIQFNGNLSAIGKYNFTIKINEKEILSTNDIIPKTVSLLIDGEKQIVVGNDGKIYNSQITGDLSNLSFEPSNSNITINVSGNDQANEIYYYLRYR